jgi:hypothetical protein
VFGSYLMVPEEESRLGDHRGSWIRYRASTPADAAQELSAGVGVAVDEGGRSEP